MTNSKSCWRRFSIPFMFWTGAFLILFAPGLYCDSEDQIQSMRYPRYDSDSDGQGYSPTFQETYDAINFLRELIQKQQQRTSQKMQMYNNGEDLNEALLEWNKVTFPLYSKIRNFINYRNKEENNTLNKRRENNKYMSICHFKVCNMGKK